MATPGGRNFAPPGVDGTRTPYSTLNNAKFNPTMAVIIIVLIGGCFLAGFISVFVRKCMMGATPAGTGTGTSTTAQGWSAKTRGLDKAAVDALPMVHSKDLDEKDDRECPVCLTEFEAEDSLRLLPACKHVFHQVCIDAWFDAHSTCPLCRASLTGQPGADAAGASVPAAQVETVVEVSEHSDSDNDVQGSALRDLEMRADVAAPSATITREDERNSTRGALSQEDERSSARETLFRNSQSFKRAVRGTTALEKAASLGAPAETSKPPTAPGAPPKPPLTPSSTAGIRRASTDLIALRSLLTGDATNSSNSLNRSGSGAASTSWFSRARSMDLGSRSRDLGPARSTDNWSHIDLESGKPPGASSKPNTSIAGERAWSDRWSLASLRGAMFPLSRSASDISARANPHL